MTDWPTMPPAPPAGFLYGSGPSEPGWADDGPDEGEGLPLDELLAKHFYLAPCPECSGVGCDLCNGAGEVYRPHWEGL